MKDQVFLVKENGNLCGGVPLFRMQHEESLCKMEGFVVSLTNEKPVLYLMDVGIDNLTPMNAEFVEGKLESIGDL